MQKFAGVQMRVSGYNDLKKFILGAGLKCKNRDEFINSTVRVRLSNQILIMLNTFLDQILNGPGTERIIGQVISFRTVSHIVTNVAKWH